MLVAALMEIARWMLCKESALLPAGAILELAISCFEGPGMALVWVCVCKLGWGLQMSSLLLCTGRAWTCVYQAAGAPGGNGAAWGKLLPACRLQAVLDSALQGVVMCQHAAAKR